MAFAVKDRVKEISSTTGTGSLTLGGAVTGYQSFNAALSTGDTTYYVIENPNTSEWETGLGTFTSPSTLARTTVLSSSTGSAVSFTAGAKNVFISLPATQFPAANTTIVGTDATQTLTNKSISGASNTVTNVSLTTGVTGTLPVANGGTGVTSSTGTGSVVLSASPTFTGTVSAAAITATGNLTVNKGTPIATFSDTGGFSRVLTVGVADAFNGSVAMTGGGDLYLKVGGTTVIGMSGTTTTMSGPTVLSNTLTYGGVTLSNSVTGTGSMVLSASPTLVTPALGVATGTTLALGGATIGTNALAVTGTAAISGSVGIGTNPVASVNLYVNKSITGSAFSYSNYVYGNAQSDVTSVGAGYVTTLGTQATAFTLPSLRHFYAVQGTVGAGSTLTTQVGFYADDSLIGATNNYGFYGEIASGSNRWNLYMAGTASNYLAGSLGLGSTGLTGISLRNSLNITGATTSYGYYSSGVVQSDVTTTATYVRTTASTVASAFTLPSLIHFYAVQGTIGATSAVTTQYGFYAHSSLIGATTNYGFYSAVTAGTGRWNFYAAGTAANYFAGATTLSAALTYGGVTLSNSVTGTGSMVLSASPTFTGTLTGAISNFTTLLKTTGSSASGGQFLQNDTNAGGQTWQIGPGAGSGSPNEWNIYNQGTTTTVFKLGKTGTVSFPGALTYGGVTLSNSVTGTGSMVLSASPTFTGTPKFAGATSGTIGLVATAIAGTNTLTLPAETGTLRSTVSTGTVLQVVNYQTGTLATGTTQIPVDNTIPQNTEGTEFMSLAITPKSATSKLKIEVVAQFSGDTTSSSPTVALFQDSTANALAAAAVGSLQYIGDKVFTHYMTSPGTGTYTFKVRIGQNFAGTITFNGSGSAGLFGGTTPSSITITEVVP